eukprot:5805839-Pyramimonas_sp.AAC.1
MRWRHGEAWVSSKLLLYDVDQGGHIKQFPVDASNHTYHVKISRRTSHGLMYDGHVCLKPGDWAPPRAKYRD